MDYKDLFKIIENWIIWLSLIFLLIPGVIYQKEILNENLLNYGGTLVIIFLLISIYYSIPFILLSIFMYGILNSFKKSPKDKTDLFLVSLYSILGYIGITIIQNLSWVKNNLNFWGTYIMFMIVSIFLGYKSWIELFKNLKNGK